MSNIIIPFRANLESGCIAPPIVNTKSLLFDGIDDYVNIGRDASLDIFGGDFTISLWAKWGAQTTNSNGIVNFAGAADKAMIGLGFSSNYGKITFGTGNATTIGVLYNMGSGYDDNQWHNIVCTLDAGVRTCYVDGVDITATGLVSNIAVGTNNDIGNRARSRYFVGNIDEVCLLDRVVTPAEIVTLSTIPTNLICLNPIAWFRNGDNGSYKSPQWLIPNNENFAANKVSNYSTQFDGNDDYIDCGVISAFQSTANFSISFWLKVPNLAASNFIFSTFTSGSNTIYCYLTSSGEIVFSINNSFNKLSGVANPLAAGQWYNIALVYDGGIPSMEIYIDGVIGTGATVTPPILTGTNTAISTIGLVPFGNYFEGSIDEFAIYDYSLTATEALAIGGTVPTDLSLLATPPTNYYKMGENATFVYGANPDGTWTIPDEIGTNDGTSNNVMVDSARIGDAPSSTNNALSFNMDFVDVVTDVPT